MIEDINAGAEAFFSSHADAPNYKMAFILCDDYTELATKLYLKNTNPNWSDSHDKEAKKFMEAQKRVADAVKTKKKPSLKDIEIITKSKGKERFKSYRDVMGEVHNYFTIKRKQELAKLTSLQTVMVARHDQRNSFFHSATLLGLGTSESLVIDSFCDLLDYCKILFGVEWEEAGAGYLKLYEIIFRIKKKSQKVPMIDKELDDILGKCPINQINPSIKKRKTGLKFVPNNDMLYLRLCVKWDYSNLIISLQGLLTKHSS